MLYSNSIQPAAQPYFIKDAARPAATGQSNYKKGRICYETIPCGQNQKRRVGRPRWERKDFFGGGPAVPSGSYRPAGKGRRRQLPSATSTPEEIKRQGVGILCGGPFRLEGITKINLHRLPRACLTLPPGCQRRDPRRRRAS